MPANEDVSLGPASKQRMVLILSVKCMMLAICIISRNIARFTSNRTYVFIGIMIFAFIMIAIWLIIFMGAIHENYGLIYFGWAMWSILTFAWVFLIVGCITPTRCSESLWLIENKERMEFRIETKINFYYHDYHEPLPDRLPKNMDHEHGHRDYEDIPYVVEYDPMIEFIKFYIPWKSVYGAMIFLSSFMTIFIYFVWTAHILKTYADQLYIHTFKRNTRRAVCSC